MIELISDGEFWVAFGAAVFVAILVWQKVPALIAKSLDARAGAIAKELDDARKLREDAEGLLDGYKRKQAEADGEVAAIIAEAHSEAERYGSEARAAIEAQIARRAKAAEDRIAQAETQAIAELRAMAADAAVTAAEKLISERMNEVRDSELVKAALKDIPGKLN